MKASLIAVMLVAAAALPGRGEVLPEGAEQLGGYYDFRTWQTEVNPDGFRERVRHRLVILSPRGDHLANLAVSSDGFRLLDGVKAEIFDSQGKKIYTRKEGDWGKVCGFGASFALYDDVCIRYINAVGPGYPYAIEWEAEWHAVSLFRLSGADFQQDVPVVRAEYELSCPSDLDFQYRVSLPDLEPEIQAGGNRLTYVWKATDLPARDLQGDGFLPPEQADFGGIVFSPGAFRLDQYRCEGRSWDAIAAWYRDMARDRYLPGDQVGEVQIDRDSALVLAEQIYRGVVDKNRYVSISIGVGGWQPHSAASTEANGYGDCKDLSTLLISRLRCAGLDARPVLVLTRNAGVIDSSLPSPRFNHVIAMLTLGTDTVWMDPTCDVCSFGDIPTPDEDILVLAITNDRGAVVRTPASSPLDNQTVRRTDICISSDAKPSFESRWSATRNAATALQGVLRHSDAEERTEILKSRLSRAVRTWTVQLQKFELQEAEGRPLRVEVRGGSDRALVKLGNRYVLTPFIFSPVMPQEDIDLSSRTLAVDLGFPRTIIDTVVVSWSRAFRLDSITGSPDSVCSFSLGTCAVTLQVHEDSAVAVRVQQITGYTLPPEEFPAFRAYCAARNRLSETCLHLGIREVGE